MNNTCDNVELILPLKAEYVSVARLAASGIASRVGFDIETIEDIKVTIAEVCNKLIRIGSNVTNSFKILFEIKSDSIGISFFCEDDALKCVFNHEEDEFALAIINALMDDVQICSEENYIFYMSKALEGVI